MASQIGEPITTDDMRYYFKKFDANGDGFITSDELALVMKTFGGKTYSKREIDDMIKEADVDADGKVSYDGKLFKFISCNFGLSSAFVQQPFYLISWSLTKGSTGSEHAKDGAQPGKELKAIEHRRITQLQHLKIFLSLLVLLNV